MKITTWIFVGTALAVAGVAHATDVVTEGEATVLKVGTGGTISEADQATLNANGAQEFWITGGTLQSYGIASFNGVVRVKSGAILQVGTQGGLGSNSATVYVEDGGTLEIVTMDADPMTGTETAFECALHLSGRGASTDYGALRLAYTVAYHYATMHNLHLDADAFVNVTAVGWYTRGTLDLHGHTLAKSGSQWSYFNSTIANPGHIVLEKGTLWMTQDAKLFDASGVGTITLKNGTELSLWMNKLGGDWKVVCEENSSFYTAKNGTFNSTWYGKVEVKSGATFTVTGDMLKLYGPLTGEGNFYCSVDCMLYGTNTLSGTITANGRTVTAVDGDALPTLDATKYVANGAGSFNLPLLADDAEEGTRGWSGASVTNVLAANKDVAGRLPFAFYAAPGTTTTVADPFEAVAYKDAAFFAGGGTVKFTGDLPSAWPVFYALDTTTVVIARADVSKPRTLNVTDFRVTAGHLSFENAGTIDLGQNSLSSSGSANRDHDVEIAVGEGSALTVDTSVNKAYFQLNYQSSSAGYARLRVTGGALTNCFSFCYHNESCVTFLQSGGDVYNRGSGGYDSQMSPYGHLYQELSGGTYGIRSWTRIAQNLPASGVIYQKGGTFHVDGSTFCIPASGTGVLYQTGGRLTTAANDSRPIAICYGNYSGSRNRGGMGNMTVKGADAVAEVNAMYFQMADITNSVSFVNLMDGGTLRVPHVVSPAVTEQAGKQYSLEGAGNLGYVGFNGGVLKPNAYTVGSWKNEIFGDPADARWRPPTRVTVYAGGATIDTDGYDVSVRTPLQKPEGKGIAALAIPAEADATGFYGAPVVRITGDGAGASAVAEYDAAAGRVTGVTVTSPGWNYTTATAHLIRGGHADVALDVTLATTPTTGGLVKKGAGTLTLNAANTFGGAAVIRGGTLKLGVANALAAGVAVKPAGGVLAVADGVAWPAALDAGELDFSDEKATLALADFSNGVPSPRPTVTNLAPGWRVRVKNGTYAAWFGTGAAIILR